MGWLLGKKKEADITQAEQAADGPSTTDPEHIRAVLTQWIIGRSRGRLREDDIVLDVEMFDAGYIDSMTGAELLVHIERTFGVFIPEIQLVSKLARMDDLIEHIAASANR